MIQPHAKNKNITKKLGLTRASISFHTQKLLNSSLLELMMDDDSVKYMVNKELIQIRAKAKHTAAASTEGMRNCSSEGRAVTVSAKQTNPDGQP